MTIFRSTNKSSSSSTCNNNNNNKRIGLLLAGVLGFTVFQLYYNELDDTKSLFQYEQYLFVNHTRQEQEEKEKQPEEFLLESFAISFDPSRVEQLQQRNAHAHLGTVLWVPGVDGLQQRTLNLWAQLTKSNTAMTVEQASQLGKGDYRSPHAVGVYLSHWNLLRTLAHRPPQLIQKQQQEKQQHAYLILEDDATCAPGLDQEIARVIPQLPSDWDLLFVGGKPFSYFEDSNAENNNNNNNNNQTTTLRMTKQQQYQQGQQLILDFKQQEAANNWTGTAWMNQRIRQAVCQGLFGQARGPFAPDGSRRLSPDTQPYWKVDYLTNTHSYVVNPHRVAHLSNALQPTLHVPVDIRLGDLMKSGQINAYMTTQQWCDQTSSPDQTLPAPQTWSGFFVLDWKYLWQTQLHLDEDCAF